MTDPHEWTETNAQQINEMVMTLDELKEELGADSVQWEDEPQQPSPVDKLDAMLQDMRGIAADFKQAITPGSVLGELLAERNSHLQIMALAAQWMENATPIVEQARAMLTEKDA